MAFAAWVLRTSTNTGCFTRQRGPTVHTAVLIVDDDRDIRESLTDMLRHEGYLVESAGSGNEGPVSCQTAAVRRGHSRHPAA